MTLLPDWLHQRALVSPDRLAVAAAGERLTFAMLDARVSAWAGWLKSLGVVEGERVAVLLRNGLPFVTLVHAMARLGAVLVPLNSRLTPAEIGWQLNDVRTRWLLCDEYNWDQARAATQVLAAVRVINVEIFAGSAKSPDFAPKSGDFGLRQSKALGIEDPSLPPDVAASRFNLESPHSILYTSGTTGQPKGAVLTFGNHWWSAIGSALNLGLHTADRWLACMPLFHVGGLAILLRAVIYGNSVIVHETFDPDAVNRAIDEEAISIVSMVATMLQRTLEARGDRPFPESLRCILLGGGPAPRSLLEECARRTVPVMQTYGLTEAASQVATLSLEDALRKLGSAGKPLLPTELRIEPEGEGEIIIRGPTITPGYLDRPEANARAFREGWFHTGDIGYLDAEGYLYILDRRDDLIISGGENVYPAEIEGVLRSHPAVSDVGVVGVADDTWGQVPVAFVVRRDPEAVDESSLHALCAERLARYKVPRQIKFVESLPRNAGGKLLRRALLTL